MSDPACGFPTRTWWERNGSWIVGSAGLVAAALIAYGVATGTATERLSAQDQRIERVEAQQRQTDSTIRDVRDSLIKIGSDVAVTRAGVEATDKRLDRIENRIDAAAAGGRRNP